MVFTFSSYRGEREVTFPASSVSHIITESYNETYRIVFKTGDNFVTYCKEKDIKQLKSKLGEDDGKKESI